MGLFRPSRTQYGPDPYYHWKVILFSVGAACGLAAIVTGRDWLILVAVPILAVGVGLRWLPRRGEGASDEGPPEEEDEEPEGPEPPDIPPPA